MTAKTNPSTLPSGARFQLGDWLVAADENALHRGTQRVALEPKIMRVLVYLAEHAGEVVSTEQLLIDCWRGTFYGDNPVHKTIAVLRKALEDDPATPKYIQTIRKRGYRLLVPVVFPEHYTGASSEAVATWTEGCPFRGLEPFQADHARIFFGRSRAIAGLLQAARDQIERGCAFVLIAGASGSGKSSLVQAGVLPLMMQSGGFDNLQAAFSGVVNPGNGDPMQQLATLLTTWRNGDWPLFVAGEIPKLAADLADQPAGVLQRIRMGLARVAGGQGASPLAVIVVDPLESLLSNPAASAETRAEFVRALAALAQSGQVLVLALCRSDLYPRLGEIPGLLELKNAGAHYDLGPPSDGDIAEMIRLPAQAAGLRFGRDGATRGRLDDVLRDAASGRPDALPLLQYVLRELYERRTPDGELPFSAYQEIGGIEGALARHAEAALDALPAAVRDCLPDLLQQMVIVGEDGSVAGRALKAEEVTNKNLPQLLRAFVDARLFVGGLDGSGAYVAAAHDALWRCWPRVVEWVDRNRTALQAHTRLEVQARRWAQAGRSTDFLLTPGLPLAEAQALRGVPGIQLMDDERDLIETSIQRQRRAQRIRTSIISLLVISSLAAGVSGLYAWRARQQAERSSASAESLIAFMLGDLTNQLRPLGKLDVLDGIGEQVLKHLNSAETSGNLIAQLQSVDALTQVGSIDIERGATDKATTALAKADQILAKLDQRYADDPELLFKWGNVKFGLGNIAYKKEQYDEADRHFRAYEQIAQRLTQAQPDESRSWVELSYAYNNLGTLEQARGNKSAAHEDFEKSLLWKRKALAQSPNDGKLKSDLANGLSWSATELEDNGHLKEAAARYAEATQLVANARASAIEDVAISYRESVILLRSGDLKLAMGDISGAEADYKRAKSNLHVLTQTEPAHLRWRLYFLFAEVKLSKIALLNGHAQESLNGLPEIVSKLNELSEKNPKIPAFTLIDARAQMLLGETYMALGRYGQAAEVESRTVNKIKALMQAGVEDDETRGAFASALDAAGAAEQRNGDVVAAAVRWQQVVDLVSGRPSAAIDKHLLDPLTRALVNLGRLDEAAVGAKRLKDFGYAEPSFDTFLSSVVHRDLKN